jgi:hypothetical protein
MGKLRPKQSAGADLPLAAIPVIVFQTEIEPKQLGQNHGKSKLSLLLMTIALPCPLGCHHPFEALPLLLHHGLLEPWIETTLRVRLNPYLLAVHYLSRCSTLSSKRIRRSAKRMTSEASVGSV